MKEPILQIPNLAIHISDDPKGTFKWDNEVNLRPILATMIVDSLIDQGNQEEKKKEESKEESSVYGIEKKHLKTFLDLIASHAESLPENVVDFELSMYDTNPSSIIGLHKEFISSPRIDNMVSSICAAYALSERSESVTEERTIEMIILYDHEEIGSESAQGAASSMTSDVLK